MSLQCTDGAAFFLRIFPGERYFAADTLGTRGFLKTDGIVKGALLQQTSGIQLRRMRCYVGGLKLQRVEFQINGSIGVVAVVNCSGNRRVQRHLFVHNGGQIENEVWRGAQVDTKGQKNHEKILPARRQNQARARRRGRVRK